MLDDLGLADTTHAISDANTQMVGAYSYLQDLMRSLDPAATQLQSHDLLYNNHNLHNHSASPEINPHNRPEDGDYYSALVLQNEYYSATYCYL